MKFLGDLKARDGALHLMGLLSDGGVHSHQEHLYALVKAAKDAGVSRIYIHAFLDGRDTSPHGGEHYLAALQAKLLEIGAGKIATVIGRYFAMDRDNRWERVELAYKLIFLGEGTYVDDPVAAVKNEYTIKKTDEFMPALVCLPAPRPLVAEGDGILFFNFRGDRAREISQVILHKDFAGFARPYWPKVSYLQLTQYDITFDAPVMFPPQSMSHLLGEVVSGRGPAPAARRRDGEVPARLPISSTAASNCPIPTKTAPWSPRPRSRPTTFNPR